MTNWIQRIGSAILLATLSACATQGANTWPEPIGSLKSGVSTSSVPAYLPKNVRIIKPDATTSAMRQQFSGVWHGWMCKGRQCDSKLAIEEVLPESASVVYAGASHLGGSPFVQRTRAEFVDHEMVVRLRTGSTLVARLRNNTEMEVMLRRDGKVVSFGILTRTPLAQQRFDERVPTPFTRDGKIVQLELIRFRPTGNGPFPTAVMNHGSTSIAGVGLTWIAPKLVDFFIKRGWQVVFPQRRGRGRSDGVYDEGYNEQRTEYSCNPQVSVAGMDRAMADTKAVVNYLKLHSDVDAKRMLIGGVSRGGILSVAYAGQFPNDVIGVVNFVGGWMSDQCKNVAQINPVIFERGANFPNPTLWLYGRNDPFYSVAHSRTNFDRFKAKGGSGQFKEYKVPFRSGHWLHAFPDLWKDTVQTYLDQIK